MTDPQQDIEPDEQDEVPAVFAYAEPAAASGGAGPDEEGPTDALD